MYIELNMIFCFVFQAVPYDGSSLDLGGVPIELQPAADGSSLLATAVAPAPALPSGCGCVWVIYTKWK